PLVAVPRHQICTAEHRPLARLQAGFLRQLSTASFRNPLAGLVQGSSRDLPEFAARDVAILANEHDATVLLARAAADGTRLAHNFPGRRVSVRQAHAF